MKTYTFAYGDDTVSLPVDERDVISALHGQQAEPLSDVPGALDAALDAPIDAAPLHAFAGPGDKIALVVSDVTRFWMRQDRIVPHLIDYLNRRCGVPDADIVIIIANGTHDGSDEATLRMLVTDAIFRRIQVVNHDCRSDRLVSIGTTSFGTHVSVDPYVASRKVICLGACTQHLMAGFGGGRKSILPGVSSLEAIEQNHAHALDATLPRTNPAIGNGILAGNPVHLDMCEAAAMLPNLFMINLVMNAEMQLYQIYAGHWLHSWERACEVTQKLYEVPIPELADVIIASSGGYPKDISLYQGSKTVDNVESGLKPGGTLILIMECREGGGPAEYFDWLKPLREGTLTETLRAHFTIPGYIFFVNCEQARRYRILMLTRLNPDDAKAMGISAYTDLDALLRDADIAGKRTYLIENGSTVIPKLST